MAKVRKRTKNAASRFKKQKQQPVKKRKQVGDLELPEVRPTILKGKKPPAMLVDGDICMFHVVTTTIEERRHGDEYSYHLNMNDCMQMFEERITGLALWMGADKTVVAFTGRQNFRKQIVPSYKADRTQRKPLGYRDAVENAMQHEGWEALRSPALEADDLLGMYATNPALKKTHTPVIVSDDKDMLTIPSYHLRFKKSKDETKHGIFQVDRREADTNFLIQTLTGDAGDGYFGIEGYGPVKAIKTLAGSSTVKGMWKKIVEAYEADGKDEAYALAQARCARILRHGECNLKTGKLKLWTP